MTKVSYASLKLKVNDTVKTFSIENKNIEVKQYLSISDKIDLIDIVLQNSLEDGIYNPIKVNMFLDFYIVLLYTNISFTDTQKKDVEKIYDTLESNGIIEMVIANIPDYEYNKIIELLDEYINKKMYYNTTAAAILDNIIEKLPENAQQAADIMNEINLSNPQNLIEFAKSINNSKNLD